MQEVVYLMQFRHLEEETFRSIRIEQMTQVLLIPIFGIFIAVVLCLCELFSNRAKLKSN